MSGVRHDSRPQISSGFRENGEHEAIQADGDRSPCALIDVAGVKQRRRQKHANRSASSPSQLASQVATKNGLFANAGGDRESDPKEGFEQSLWSKSARGLGHSGRVNEPGYDAENEDCGNPKAESNGDIDEEIEGAFPS